MLGQHIVLVAHGGVMDALYRLATQLDMGAPRTWDAGQCRHQPPAVDARGPDAWWAGPMSTTWTMTPLPTRVRRWARSRHSKLH